VIGRRFWVVSLLSCCALLAVQCFAAPSVTSLSPTSGPIGTWVTIAGANFGSTQGTSSVTFNGIPVTTVSSWSATTIVVAVPPGTMTGNVVVTVSGIPSAGTLFTKTTAAPIPQVVQVQPANVATGVPLNARTVVRFAQAVPAVSVVNGLLTLAQGSTSVSGTVTQSNDGLSLTFVPSQNLSSSTAYSVDVTDVAADQTGPQFQSTFTT
jgi:IPT/TIG domain/Bacterial Ig-like domain